MGRKGGIISKMASLDREDAENEEDIILKAGEMKS